jgi:ribosomal protein L37AE/L43A
LFLWRGLCKIILMNSRTNYECSQKKIVRVMRIWVGIFDCSLFLRIRFQWLKG